MNTKELGFTGEVHKAQCLCHRDQFYIAVFVIHPKQGRSPFPIAVTDHFKTEDEANKELEAAVLVFAKRFLKDVGLSVDEAKKVTVAHGEEAVEREISRITSQPAVDDSAKPAGQWRETNPHLH